MKLYLDSCIAIYIVERHPTFATPSALGLAKWQPDEIAATDLTRLECLVLPRRNLNSPLITLFEDFFAQETIRILFDWNIYDLTIDLRAKYSKLKTPDAIHLAAAIRHGCDLFLTNDPDLKMVTEIRVETI